MITKVVKIRVRYSETDQMGFCYYGNYAQYYEIGRVEFIRSLGIDYKTIESMGYILPVLDMSCKFISPAKYDDLLTLETTLLKTPLVKICFSYKITNELGKLLNAGETTLAFLDSITKKPKRAPLALLNAIKKA